MKFIANIIIRGKIECKTGLHIGGSKNKIEIGGVDSIVLRNPRTLYPYLPGSSIKGKLRHLLEFSTGAVLDHIGDLGNVSKRPDIVRVFGIGADQKDHNHEDFDERLLNIGPSRLIIRDANPDEDTVKMWDGMDTELPYTEVKAENTLDRLTSAANPRFIERVVAESKFDFEMIYGVYNMSLEKENEDYKNDVKEDLGNLLLGLRLLEDSALGKSGSRGYGKIEFQLADPLLITVEDYKKDGAEFEKLVDQKDAELKPLTKFEFPKL